MGKGEIKLYHVDLKVYILVDLLLLCLANIILHFLILLEEYNFSNRLDCNNNRNEIMHSCIFRYYPIIYIVLIIKTIQVNIKNYSLTFRCYIATSSELSNELTKVETLANKFLY